jgi:hypothetical protein
MALRKFLYRNPRNGEDEAERLELDVLSGGTIVDNCRKSARKGLCSAFLPFSVEKTAKDQCHE